MNQPQDTNAKFDEIIKSCRKLFQDKNADYGTSWRALRMKAMTDQIWIKAKRIRTIQETGDNKVGDSINGEYVGILNYSILALIQMKLQNDERMNISAEEIMNLYDAEVTLIKELLQKKNHDYGEAWRDMREESYADFILQKLLRIKQIEENQGKVKASEGIDAGYQDAVNYSIFALIRIKEAVS